MKSFREFIQEANNTCNKTEKGKHCPIHGEKMCPGLLKKNYSIATTHPGNFPEETQYENDAITIEDANGNTFLEVVDVIRPEPLVKESKKMKEKDPCWKGYQMIGKKKKNGKEVPNCVPVKENYLRIQSRGTTYTILLNWRGKYITTQMFFQQFTRPSKPEVTREVRKVYPNAVVLSFMPSMKDPTKPLLFTGELDGPKKY